ncbi:hypothetical protein PLESTB_001365400 [Pleodorina starrii]|uniref:Major facilitator superfamily (MFS) profile domain-containing protein n=1 Tax=Pleodorina starrii TaxID=330485 RepID=A0A9W6BVC3_9CHLO|nr:hypothetical protein PLESTM_000419600 [Pleodorina starrii]GLC58477.1 hypothetical protein PLESTB_001365400 [Pleodorina starrii]GLC74135.1 hypothetical protein PLESTF_001465600 [Pleodorina starrii]
MRNQIDRGGLLEADSALDGSAACEDGGNVHVRQIESSDDSDDARVDMNVLFRKISTRLLPLFFVMVIMCYVDRTSLAFAAIQLNASLGFSPSVYGVGSGLFFLGYSLFQVPSNLLLRRLGGPTWLASIIAAWGLTASAFAGMSTAAQFYALRLLLGATEAGAFPGMWYVLTTFYPGDQITFPFAVVEAGISLSHVVAAPLAAACLSLDGLGGLAGWRWLFLLEGLPTIVLAAVFYRLLPRSPETADFLTASERRALTQRIEQHNRSEGGADGGSGGDSGGLKCVSSVAGNLGSGGVVKRARQRSADGSGVPGGSSGSGSASGQGGGGCSGSGHGRCVGDAASSWAAVRKAISNKYVWCMGGIKFTRDIASFGLIFWAPTIVNSLLLEMRRSPGQGALLGVSADAVSASTGSGDGAARSLLGAVMPLPADGHQGSGAAAVLLTALPFALAAACGMLLAHSSQRTGERFLHISMPYIITGGALTLYSRAASRSPWLGFLALSLGVIGVYCGSGPSLSLISELAAGPGLVVALPLYNSLGTLGGFLGPAIVGWLVQRANSSAASGTSAAAVIQGGGFGVSAVVLGTCLFLAGVMVLLLGAAIGRIPELRGASTNAGPRVSSDSEGSPDTEPLLSKA